MGWIRKWRMRRMGLKDVPHYAPDVGLTAVDYRFRQTIMAYAVPVLPHPHLHHWMIWRFQIHFAKFSQGLARSLHTVILHLAQNNHALFLIQFVDIELVAPIFPMEYHIQNAAHMPRPHIVVGVDVDPIAILGRFHMGTEDLVHIKPTR